MKGTVDNKAEFYARFLAGEFGNMIPHYRSYEEYAGSRHASCRVGVRRTEPGMPFLVNLSPAEAEAATAAMEPGSYMIGVATPDDLITMQGEFMRLNPHGEGYCLHYSHARVTMRRALAEFGLHSVGVRSLLLLRHFMWPSSYSDFEVLLDRYQSAVIEFTCFDVEVGDWPGRNTVIWEVRDY